MIEHDQNRSEEDISVPSGVAGGKDTQVRTRDRILQRLRTSGRVVIQDLATELDVSVVTIHRHLATLEEEGLIIRSRGVAQLFLPPGGAGTDYGNRLNAHVEAKQVIARKALEYLPARGGAVFLDASTTCLYLAREIMRSISSELTIVTTSPAILSEFASHTVRVIALPGELDQVTRVVGGPWTVEFLATLHVQAAFISGIGLTLETGLTTQRRAISDVLKHVASLSPQTYMLVDSSKFTTTALLHIAWPWEATAIITDTGLAPEVITLYRDKNVNMVIADSTASTNR
jgi:DeoR family fructose operon transcriptional repressor